MTKKLLYSSSTLVWAHKIWQKLLRYSPTKIFRRRSFQLKIKVRKVVLIVVETWFCFLNVFFLFIMSLWWFFTKNGQFSFWSRAYILTKTLTNYELCQKCFLLIFFQANLSGNDCGMFHIIHNWWIFIANFAIRYLLIHKSL